MRKQHKSYNKGLVRTIFNNTYEASFNPYRKFYSFISIEGKDHYFEYDGKFISEARTHFEEQTRLNSGKFNGKVYSFEK
ncbi:hypothetical protein KDN24_07060 [Bacillus sp. Bva_UNVM-123]|uniref:hypothetical protein n=1 Tax=Bacillus sp. Bva_UNVM-123 TaxID=2829798 RepID=UPI00391F4A6B